MAFKRFSTAVWSGAGKEGNGKLSTTSGVLADTPYSFAARFMSEDGKAGTNPEELIAAAHSGCFTMALSIQLVNAGYPSTNLTTKATVSMDNADGPFTIVNIHLAVEGSVPGITEEKFLEIAEGAKQNCPISRALSAVPMTLSAKLV